MAARDSEVFREPLLLLHRVRRICRHDFPSTTTLITLVTRTSVLRRYHRNMVGLMPTWAHLLKTGLAEEYEAGLSFQMV